MEYIVIKFTTEDVH